MLHPFLLSEILSPAMAGFSSSVRPPALAGSGREWYAIVPVLDVEKVGLTVHRRIREGGFTR